MRIYTSANDPIDLCSECRISEDEARERFGNVGDGPDGRGNCFGYDDDHPPYEDISGMYECHECHRQLTEED